VAIRLYTRAGQNYEKVLRDYHDVDVLKGEENMRKVLQKHLEAVAPEICYGINGLSQNSFQRIVAIIGKHTIQESLDIATKEKARKKKFTRTKREISRDEDQRKRDSATAAYEWLEQVFTITLDDLEAPEGEDYRL
jgi:hypothetical protein